MPNIKSAKKRVQVIATKTARNKTVRSDLRTAIKKAEFAMAESTADKDAAVKLAVRKIDKAVRKGIMHKNAAARKKSQLVRKMNAAE